MFTKTRNWCYTNHNSNTTSENLKNFCRPNMFIFIHNPIDCFKNLFTLLILHMFLCHDFDEMLILLIYLLKTSMSIVILHSTYVQCRHITFCLYDFGEYKSPLEKLNVVSCPDSNNKVSLLFMLHVHVVLSFVSFFNVIVFWILSSDCSFSLIAWYQYIFTL